MSNGEFTTNYCTIAPSQNEKSDGQSDRTSQEEMPSVLGTEFEEYAPFELSNFERFAFDMEVLSEQSLNSPEIPHTEIASLEIPHIEAPPLEVISSKLKPVNLLAHESGRAQILENLSDPQSDEAIRTTAKIVEKMCLSDDAMGAAETLEEVDFESGKRIFAVLPHAITAEVFEIMQFKSVEKFFQDMDIQSITEILLDANSLFGTKVFLWLCNARSAKTAGEILSKILTSTSENFRKARNIFEFLISDTSAFEEILLTVISLNGSTYVESLMLQISPHGKKMLMRQISPNSGEILLAKVSINAAALLLAHMCPESTMRVANFLAQMDQGRCQEILGEPFLGKYVADIQILLKAFKSPHLQGESVVPALEMPTASPSGDNPPYLFLFPDIGLIETTRVQISTIVRNDPKNYNAAAIVFSKNTVPIGIVLHILSEDGFIDRKFLINAIFEMANIDLKKLARILESMSDEFIKYIFSMANSQKITMVLCQLHNGNKQQLAGKILLNMLDWGPVELAKIINALVDKNCFIAVELFSQKYFTEHFARAVIIIKYVSPSAFKLMFTILLTLDIKISLRFLGPMDPHHAAFYFEQLLLGEDQRNAAGFLNALAAHPADKVVKIFAAMDWLAENGVAGKIFSYLNSDVAAKVLCRIDDQTAQFEMNSKILERVLLQIPSSAMPGVLSAMADFDANGKEIVNVMKVIALQLSHKEIVWIFTMMDNQLAAVIFCKICDLEKGLILTVILSILPFTRSLEILEVIRSSGGIRNVSKILIKMGPDFIVRILESDAPRPSKVAFAEILREASRNSEDAETPPNAEFELAEAVCLALSSLKI
ncbi:MAG: hypothetical protein LBI69_00955 [Puniceicoccales bacterium]|jgi:hypothetical protein|nr:hypothetical protein [Puniceicoccales bacterium]